MNRHAWLRVHDWDKWQTYRKDREPPPWIKVHRRIVHNRKWAMLTDVQKGHLLSLWITAADDDGYVPNNPTLIKKMCGLDVEPDLEVYVALGFLDVAPDRRQPDVTVTSSWRHRDAPEAEAEAETETEAEEEAAREATGFSTLPTLTQTAIAGLYGINGSPGTQEQIWKGIEDRDTRKRLVETAVLRMQGEGKAYNAPFFRSVLARVIAEEGTNEPDDLWVDP